MKPTLQSPPLLAYTSAGWQGPGVRAASRRFTWNRVLWALVFPQRGQRILPTLSGTLLIALSMGVGMAAYNSANNILFITLSLLISCLLLSGVLSWLNFRGVAWRLEIAPPWRAGQEAAVGLRLRNRKTFLSTYGLWFELKTRPVEEGPPPAPESTITGKGIDLREEWAKAEKNTTRGRLALRTRLDPGDETRLEWLFKPAKRGRMRVEVTGVGSQFPFGFLKKLLNTELWEELMVWPAPVEYRRQGEAGARRTAGGERTARVGSGGDLLALRRYASGDSHRLIHWKASARSRQLLVRQFAADSTEGLSVWLRTDATIWTRPEQFELLVSFCATFAEDLFREGQLIAAAIDDEPAIPIRGVPDLEFFLDRLAVVQPRPLGNAFHAIRENPPDPAAVETGSRLRTKRNVLTFAPDGARGVAAFVDGTQTATA